MSDLKLQLIMTARERVTGPMAAVMKGSKALGRQLGEQRKSLAAMQRQQDDISSYKAMEQANDELGKEIASAQAKVARYQRVIKRSDTTNKEWNKGLRKAERDLNRLNKKYEKGSEKLTAFSNKMQSAGINTSDLTAEQKRLTAAIDGQGKSVDKLRDRYRNLKQAQERVNKVSAAGGKVASVAAKTTAAGVAAAGVAGYFFKSQFLDTAAEFEKFEAILKTVEGSSSKAKASMNWVSDFAAKTPYELGEVTEAFVKLRAYGLDPKNGLLATLGDTASAMGKDVIDAVEAIADAVTGENERLKEFGITSSTKGNNVTYEYTDKAGNQQQAVVDKRNRKQIEETLKTIWNEKYAGASQERSRTWQGMMSNMADQWTRFTNLVMSNGLFDWMKGKLGGLLDKIDQMAADGTLEQVAKDWGGKLMGFATGVWAASEAVVNLVSGFSNLVGGAENAIYVLAGISLAPLIASVVSLGVALGPVGWTLMGISALVTGITLAFKNWDSISEWFSDKFGADEDFESSSASRRKSRARIGNGTPLIPAAAGGSSDAGTVVQQMTIHAAPGMDEAAVGREVAKALEKQNNRRRRSRRSAMKDAD